MISGKWMKAAAMLSVITFMTGCGMKQSEIQLPAETNTVSVSAYDIFENAPQAKEVEVSGQPNSVQALNPELFDDQSIQIWKGKGTTLLALKDGTLYLYDVVSAQIKAQTRTENWNRVSVYTYKAGYCVIGNIMKDDWGADAGDEPTVIVVEKEDVESVGIFYDDSLKVTNRILLNDIAENAYVSVWSVSQDGMLLIYCDPWTGLNLYNLQSQKKLNLLTPGTGSSCPDLMSIDALFFEEDNRHIVFSGQTNQNGSSAASWGRIGTDGTELENHILPYASGTAAGYSDGKLLFGEDSIFFEGRMGFVDTKTGEAVYNTNIKSTLPVSGPFFSDDGTVFATAALDTNQLEVSVWRTEDFSLLDREVIQDDREEMFYRSPQLCLFPDLGAYIVCMGGHNDIPQKTVLLNY